MNFGGERIARTLQLRALTTQPDGQPEAKPGQYRVLPSRVEGPS